MCNSRPYLANSVGLVRNFMEEPKRSHMAAAKRVLAYVKGTIDYKILFSEKLDSVVEETIGYTDSYWSRDIDDMKSSYS